MAEVLATYQYSLITSDTAYSIICTNKDVCTKAIIPSDHDGKPITSINNGAFAGCQSLTSVIIPDSVISINPGAFANCSSLTYIEIPNSVMSIDEGAFSSCSSLKNIMIGNNVTSIGYGAFDRCSSLTSVVIPDSLTSIGEGAFEGCSSLTSVVIGDSVTSIGYHAFYSCVSLKNIVIPESVTFIGGLAFGYSGILNISMLAKTPPLCGLDPLTSLVNDTILNIYCYKESLEAYKTATNLRDYVHHFVADDLRLHFTVSARAQKKYFASKEELNNSDIESLNTLRAKVQNAPIEDDDVVRLQDLKSYHHSALTSDFFTNLY